MNTKHWAPIPELVEYLAASITNGARVLEIGPGRTPFKRATSFVDRIIDGANTSIVDVNRQPLPFQDKSFDFIYCRHVVEDLWNPFLLLQEIQRVGKAGYIETPSPVAELNHDVDGGAPKHCGYIHHRWIVWDSGGTLSLVEKSSVVEHLYFDNDEELESDPFLWNTYLLWREDFPVYHYEHDFDFQLHVNYKALLQHAIGCAKTKAARVRAMIEQ